MREHRVVSEHSLGPLLLDSADRGGFLPQHLVQVFHDLQLLPPLILLPGEVPSALRGALHRRGVRCGWSARSLGSVVGLVPPALDGHPLRFAVGRGGTVVNKGWIKAEWDISKLAGEGVITLDPSCKQAQKKQ